MEDESCREQDSEHKDRILAKNSAGESEAYPRNSQFQTHRCDTQYTHHTRVLLIDEKEQPCFHFYQS